MQKNVIWGGVVVTYILFGVITSNFLFFHPKSPILLAKNNSQKTGYYVSLNEVDNEGISGILKGYKGYHYPRLGYRKHTDGWWYPQKAFK